MNIREIYPIIEAEFLTEYENVIEYEIEEITSQDRPVWHVPYFRILSEKIDDIITDVFEEHNLNDDIVTDANDLNDPFDGTFRINLSNFLKMNTTARRELLNLKLSEALENHNSKF